MPLTKLHHYLDQERFDLAKREAERLLLIGQLNQRQQAQLYRAACRVSSGLEDYYGAVTLGEMAVTAAQRAGDQETLAISYFDLGHANMMVGNTSDAVTQFDQFFSLSRGTFWTNVEPRALFNVGILYRRMKRYDDAVTTYEKAAAGFTALGQDERAIMAYQNAAWCRMLQGCPEQAEAHLARVESYLATACSERVSAEHLCQQGLYNRLRHDLERSTEVCTEVFQRYHGIKHMRDFVGQAAWILAENALDAGSMQEARVFTTLAMDFAESCRWPDLNNLVSQLYFRLSERDKASTS